MYFLKRVIACIYWVWMITGVFFFYPFFFCTFFRFLDFRGIQMVLG